VPSLFDAAQALCTRRRRRRRRREEHAAFSLKFLL